MPAKHETWMPLYIADYLGDTLHLTTEQHGAYLLLLMAAWKRGGHVPDDEAQLAQITRMADRWQTHASATVRAFFAQRDGMLWHDRVVDELHKAEALVHKRSRAGAAGAAAKWQSDGKRMRLPVAEAMPPQCVDDGPSPSPPSSIEEGGRGKRATRTSAVPAPEGVQAQTWADWLDLRKKKRAPVTATVIDGAKAEAIKAGMTLDAFLRVWCFRGSQGLQADWLKPDEKARFGGAPADPASWRETSKGIRRKGIELGLGDWNEEAAREGRGEHFPAYRARVEAKVREIESGQPDEGGQAKVADLLGGLMRRVV